MRCLPNPVNNKKGLRDLRKVDFDIRFDTFLTRNLYILDMVGYLNLLWVNPIQSVKRVYNVIHQQKCTRHTNLPP